AAVSGGAPINATFDTRAQLYNLAALRYEALGGRGPNQRDRSPPLDLVNAQVSPGLSAILKRCLAPSPADRYSDAAALAADLRRHLTDRPLHGVANRNLMERWRKWRRRQPG